MDSLGTNRNIFTRGERKEGVNVEKANGKMSVRQIRSTSGKAKYMHVCVCARIRMCVCVCFSFRNKTVCTRLRGAIDCALFSFITGETFFSVFAFKASFSLLTVSPSRGRIARPR